MEKIKLNDREMHVLEELFPHINENVDTMIKSFLQKLLLFEIANEVRRDVLFNVGDVIYQEISYE